MRVGSTALRSVHVSGFAYFGLLTPQCSPSSASCSSRQRFASSFLRTPGHPRRPCRAANTSPCRVCRGLSPPRECALPGAHKKACYSSDSTLRVKQRRLSVVGAVRWHQAKAVRLIEKAQPTLNDVRADRRAGERSSCRKRGDPTTFPCSTGRPGRYGGCSARRADRCEWRGNAQSAW